MTPITINTGTSDVIFTLISLDNYITVDINPDGPQGNGTLGWSRVLEMNNSGFGPVDSGKEFAKIDLSSILTAYEKAGASSVTLAIVVTNWTGNGQVKGTISWPNEGLQKFEELKIQPWTSLQYAFTLSF